MSSNKGFDLKQICDWVKGKVVGPKTDSPVLYTGHSVLKSASLTEVAYFFNKSYQSELKDAKPGLLITAPPFVGPLSQSGLKIWQDSIIVSCDEPYQGMAILSHKFAKLQDSCLVHPHDKTTPSEPLGKAQIHPTAIVDPLAKLEDGVIIGPFCIIGSGSLIKKGTVLDHSVWVGKDCQIGEFGMLFSGVKIYENILIGDRVRIHCNSVIGSEGFGYAPVKDAGKVVNHLKIYHLGRVLIGDDVELGACVTIDRGTMSDTLLGSKVKLDNHVHIGHNSVLQEGAIVCGGTCLAGQASLGEFSYVGGVTGIGNQVHVGAGASVGAVSLVTKDVPPGTIAVGNPQREYNAHFRAHALLNRMLKKDAKR